MPAVPSAAPLRRDWLWLVPVVIGLAAFLLLVGPRVLQWQNIAWLGRGDASTHYLGWLFFRQGPWSWPPGMNPGYGMALSNTIVYSDSNPLLALLFKPLAPWLPATFQYSGAWMLLCFVLQAWFGHRLAGLASPDPWVRAMGAVFFVFAPVMLIRITDHLSLGSHFLLLGALYLALAPAVRRRRAAWAALLAVAVLVHAYLFAMAGLLWLADGVGRLRRGQARWRALVVEAAGLLLLVALMAWLAGYFVPGGLARADYGHYRANLLAFVNPMGWSYVLRDLPQGPGDHEGYVYLGLGVMLLYGFALPAVLARPQRLGAGLRRHAPLVAALAALAVFAVTHRVGLGLRDWALPMPEALLGLAGVFRAAGRMIWPVYYAVLLLAIVLVWRGYRPRTARVLLFVALCVQLLDTHAGWSRQRWHWMRPPVQAWPTPLQDPFWTAAAARHDAVRWLPAQNAGPHWRTLAEYAGRHGMATDAVYLARMDDAALARLRGEDARRIEGGGYEAGTLYVLDDALFRVAAAHGDGGHDLFARIDGLNVVAPGWRGCAECPAPAGVPTGPDSMPALQAGMRLGFATGDDAGAAYLAGGWSHRETWGTWSEGGRATLLLPLAGAGLSRLEFEVRPLLGERLTAQRVQVLVDGVAVHSGTVAAPGRLDVSLPAAPDDTQESRPRLSRVEFILPDATRPADVGGGDDPRRLGIGLIALVAR